MTEEQVQAAIEAALKERKATIVNRNALKALFGAFSDPVGALGQVFMGRSEAIDAERQRLEQQAVLKLVCRIDEALSEALAALKSAGASRVIVQGLIETDAVDAGVVTGVEVSADSGQVEFKPGTHIRTTGKRVSSLTGLRIGGDRNEEP